ncbi:signal peptidase I [Bacteroides sp. UBA939]|uniref:signal peptidase I n=1 Tax=Bacteroides sp. UBA939 TaxID=1946092 RepID=UPI0025B7F884|nr:signal peptidase I [Bacteroides sp. UBA939]
MKVVFIGKNKKQIFKKLGYIVLGLFALFQIYLFIRLYWLASCSIPTYSMSPTLKNGDYILVSLQIPGRREINEDADSDKLLVRRVKGMRQVRKDDVVVFNFPYTENESRMTLDMKIFYCKRCVATPGEIYSWWWEERVDSVYLPHEGETLTIDTLNFHHYSHPIEYETGRMPELVDGIVMHADTMMNSYRFKSNYYFMQGDNYAGSYDSRFWGILPEDFILGVGLFTWFSKEPKTGKIRWERMFRKL